MAPTIRPVVASSGPMTSDEIRLPRLDGEMSNQYRAGFLAGRLFARLFEQRERVDVELLMAAGVYGATLAKRQ